MTAALQSVAQQRASELAWRFAALPHVAAVALSGSLSSGAADAVSDIDLYVYTHTEIPLADRAALIAEAGGASRADLNLPYWGGVNVWVDTLSGISIDCMYLAWTTMAWPSQKRAIRGWRCAGG